MKKSKTDEKKGSDKKGHVSEKEKIQKIIDEKDTQINELTDTLQRLQAEFENFKKRTDKECSDFMKYASTNVIKEILPVYEALGLAVDNSGDQDDNFTNGVKLVYKSFHDTLEKMGLRQIEPLGKRFDSNFHDVMLTEETDGEDGVVLQELQKGYIFNDKVLRHSKVKISQNNTTKEPKQEFSESEGKNEE